MGCCACFLTFLPTRGRQHLHSSPQLSRIRSVQLFTAKDFLADVRPEFLEDVIQHSGFHLRSPVAGGLTQAALLWRIVQVSQCGFQSIAPHLGPAKARATRICLADEGTGYRVAGSVKKTSLTQGVIARVLVRDGRDNSLGEKSS